MLWAGRRGDHSEWGCQRWLYSTLAANKKASCSEIQVGLHYTDQEYTGMDEVAKIIYEVHRYTTSTSPRQCPTGLQILDLRGHLPHLRRRTSNSVDLAFVRFFGRLKKQLLKWPENNSWKHVVFNKWVLCCTWLATCVQYQHKISFNEFYKSQ